MALTNKNDHKNNYKEIFEKLVREIFHEIKELPVEISYNNLI